MASITAIATAMNAQADKYEIGGLPGLRKLIKGGGNVSSILFNTSKGSVNEQHGWAHHSGGNKELQFNIGIEKELDRFASVSHFHSKRANRIEIYALFFRRLSVSMNLYAITRNFLNPSACGYGEMEKS